MKWTNVARDYDGDDVQWCGHWHASAEDANGCIFVPENKDTDVYILPDRDFDPLAATPCDHSLHPAECQRCLDIQCVHLQYTDECPRCRYFEAGEFGEYRYTD